MKPRLIQGDCLDILPTLKDIDLIIADPPYNLGIDYGQGKSKDKLPRAQYLHWTENWLGACYQALSEYGTIWVIGSSEWIAHASVYLEELGMFQRNHVIWYETFGTNCTYKFNRCARHLLYYVKDRKRFTFNSNSPSIRRLSDRQVKYDDKRANPKGKLLDDVWTDIPRLAGTHGERIKNAPTQLPLNLVKRLILATSNSGDLVVDPFAGTGTVLEACLRTRRRCIGIELEERWCRVIRRRLGNRVTGE